MKKIRVHFNIVFTALPLLVLISCTQPKISDIDGNSYKIVTIGNQTWMAENLNVSRFRNGDPIPEVQSREEWKIAGENKKPAWCYFNNNPSEGDVYGKLYNWYAITDSRGLAPEGWRIPELDDWDALLNYLNESGNAAAQLKSSKVWYEGPGNNRSGYSGVPSGDRDQNGVFHGRGISVSWWSLEMRMDSLISIKWHHYEHEDISDALVSTGAGLAVRCIRTD